MARQCLVAAIRHQVGGESSAPTGQDLQQSTMLMLPKGMVIEGAECEELEGVIVGNDKEKFFQVRVQLPSRKKEKLIVFLRENIDVFAQDTYEAPGVDPNFIYHHLNVNPSVIPKKQLPRHSSKDYSDAVKEEVVKLKWA